MLLKYKKKVEKTFNMKVWVKKGYCAYRADGEENKLPKGANINIDDSYSPMNPWMKGNKTYKEMGFVLKECSKRIIV